jgi:hypothetical protein
VDGAGLGRLVDEASIAADSIGLAGDSGGAKRRRSGAEGLLSWCEIRHLVLYVVMNKNKFVKFR